MRGSKTWVEGGGVEPGEGLKDTIGFIGVLG